MRHEEFLEANPRRLGPAEVLGYGWMPASGGQPLRAAWLPGTGELYVSRPDRSAAVEVLAVYRDRAEMERAVRGWEEWGSGPGSLERLRAATFDHRPATTPERPSGPPPDAPWARASLPADEFRKVVAAIIRETGESLVSVSDSLELDVDYVAAVMRGDIEEIDAYTVKALSDTLVLSPEDLWGGELGAAINWVYGGDLSPEVLHRLPPPPEPVPPEPRGPDRPEPDIGAA